MRRYLLYPPFKDELTTSWIARNALQFGMKPSELSSLITENSATWRADLDVYINGSASKNIATNVGMDESKLHRLTFYGSSEFFYSQSEKTPQVKWVMPLGQEAIKKQFSVQYCPCCLVEDGKRPYFRKHWRLG
ncbi:MAG: TniQ family protein, partial [Bacteroidota bacterium]|nr:TniQ family protein [Bacteroidota bacterium]